MPQELSGQGYGSRPAHGVFEALRRDGKRVIAKCPFTSSYAARTALLDGLSQTDRTPARTALLDDHTPRLSKACPNGISNFVGCD
ncbi:GNAT family N-acetyltransferase [Bradyrhizobium sp. AZCC 1577]|uniref:GNAT family N-acetyltransferase n=1 Tax=Bradyrhizobium sp. AZCC 1577 TaxID=3117019 RepID=UPI003FA60718